MSALTLTGSCQIDSRGSLRASIIRNEGGGNQYFNCTDPSLIKVIRDMYYFLHGSEKVAWISGKRLTKQMTIKQQRHYVSLSLGCMTIKLFTTKKPAVAWLVIDLPFQMNVYEENEVEAAELA